MAIIRDVAASVIGNFLSHSTYFLREFARSGTTNGKAAEIVVSTIEKQILSAPNIESCQLIDARGNFRVWQTHQE
jgi:hypothetical protein